MDQHVDQNIQPTTDDLDDVEAHGLKEVAAGVGAAALIGGAGAGAALASSSDANQDPAQKPLVKTAVQHVQDQKDEALRLIRDNHAPERSQADGMQANSTQKSSGTDAAAIMPVENPVVKAAKKVTHTVKQAAGNTVDQAADRVENTQDRVERLIRDNH